jgi:hypothetical protein
MISSKRNSARSASGLSTDSDSDLGTNEGSHRHKRSKHEDSEDFEIRGVQTIKVHILKTKMSHDEFVSLESLAKSRALAVSPPGKGLVVIKLCNRPQDAEVIITNTHMSKRLERSVNKQVAVSIIRVHIVARIAKATVGFLKKHRAVVTPEWLAKSFDLGTPQPCEDYAALQEMRESTRENCPDQSQCQSQSQETDEEFIQGSSTQSHSDESIGAWESIQLPETINLHYSARYCCQRLSPLVCPNQELVEQLAVVMRSREIEGETINMLSYERAIATIKGLLFGSIFYDYRLSVM